MFGRKNSPKLQRRPPRAASAKRKSARTKLNTESELGGHGYRIGSAGGPFVESLARGLEVLGAFRADDGALGNQEIAARTRLPKATVSRLTHTLTQLEFLTHSPRSGTYELGGAALALSFTVLASLDVRRIARPFMQKLADRGNINVGLGCRDRHRMLYIQTCEGKSLVQLRLSPGHHVPIEMTAMGRAYVAALNPVDRSQLLDQLRRRAPDEWPSTLKGFERAIEEIDQRGFCTSFGEWHSDINAAGAPVAMPDGHTPYAINIGGPAYLVPPKLIEDDYGPHLADVARQISAALGAGVTNKAARDE